MIDLNNFNFMNDYTDFNEIVENIDDFKTLVTYYNDISIYNSDDIENAKHCNLLCELCDYLEILNNDREIKEFQKLTDILFETLNNDKRHLTKECYNKLFTLLYHVYKLHFCISEILNDYNINDIFKD